MRTHLIQCSSAIALLTGVAVMLTVWGCGDDDHDGLVFSPCQTDPWSCDGASGTLCEDESDCDLGLVCCKEKSNCGGGMCTRECKEDRDCPSGMLCEHSVCFFMCSSDGECAEGMSCEHGNTICEWP